MKPQERSGSRQQKKKNQQISRYYKRMVRDLCHHRWAREIEREFSKQFSFIHWLFKVTLCIDRTTFNNVYVLRQIRKRTRTREFSFSSGYIPSCQDNTNSFTCKTIGSFIKHQLQNKWWRTKALGVHWTMSGCKHICHKGFIHLLFPIFQLLEKLVTKIWRKEKWKKQRINEPNVPGGA